MSRWWRAYEEAIDDPKLGTLTDRQFRAWFNLLCLASTNGGRLPNDRATAFKLRMEQARAAKIVDELIAAGLFERQDDQIIPHNWNGRQYKSDVSTARVKRFRNAKRNVSETPPEYRVQSTDKNIDRSKLDWPEDYRERFWQAYPRKVGKGAAIRKLEALRKSGEIAFDRLLAAVNSIKTTEEKFIPYPLTWLNQGRWEDYEPRFPLGDLTADQVAEKHGYQWNGEKYVKDNTERVS